MTLPLNSRLSALYDTNGTQKDFSFGFRVFFDPDNGGYGLEVRRQTADGYEVIPKSDYLVLPVEDNSAGVVRFSVAPSAGQQIYIAGKTPTIQQLVLTNFGRYSAESIETQFDFITAIIQEWLSALGEETRQRIAADDILTQYVVQRIDDFVQQINQNFDDKSQEIEDYIATIMPSFTQALRDEIEAYAVAGMQDAIDQTLAESKAEIDDAVARANAAALAAAITGKVYDTPAAGVDPVTGVQNGAYYNVRSPDDDSYLVEYQNVGGVPTPSGKSYPSGAAVLGLKEAVDNLKTDKIDAVESIVELLNINNPQNGHTAILNGRQGGQFVYDSARAGENDGGVVFNGWVRVGFDYISFDMFDCDDTGATAIDDKLLKICAASTALKKPIHNFSGTYLIDSTNNFYFTENTLLDGSIIKLGPNFNGRFYAKRADIENFTVNSGVGFNGLKALGVLQAGRYSINGSGFDYPDHYARFVNGQPLYIYRGATKTALHFTRLLREQRLENAPYVQYDLTSLTEVNLQTPASSIRLYSGFCFDETLLNVAGDIRYFRAQDSNKVFCRNTRFIDEAEGRRIPNTTRITAENCYNIVLDGETETSAFRNADDTYAYTLTLNLCYDVVVRNFKGLGAGGASTGSNNCSRVTFEDCVLTRIDFHEPCYDWLKVKNCNVGGSGISVTMIGDLHIDGGELFMWESGLNRAYIASRSDMGGFCHGDLYIDNLKIGGYSGNNAVILEARGDGVLPVGSPLQPVFFNNVFIDGLYNNSSNTNPSGLLSCNVPTTLLKMPKYIKVDTLTKFNPIINVGVFAARISTDLVRIDLHNINHNLIWLQDLENKGTKLKVNITNANNNGGPCQVVSTANADIDIVDTQLAIYSEYNTAWTSFSPRIKIRGGSVLFDQYLGLQSGADAKNRITMNAVSVDVPAASVNTMLPRARHRDCTFGSDGWITLWSSTPVVNTGSFTTSIYSGLLDLVIGWGTQKRVVRVDARQAGTYTIEAGVVVVVTISGTTATVTLNATGANLLGVAGNI